MNDILFPKPLQQLENGSKRWKNCRHWKFQHVFDIARDNRAFLRCGKSAVTISIGRNGKTAITGSFRKSLKNEQEFPKVLITKSASMISLMEKLPSLEGKIAVTCNLGERLH